MQAALEKMKCACDRVINYRSPHNTRILMVFDEYTDDIAPVFDEYPDENSLPVFDAESPIWDEDPADSVSFDDDEDESPRWDDDSAYAEVELDFMEGESKDGVVDLPIGNEKPFASVDFNWGSTSRANSPKFGSFHKGTIPVHSVVDIGVLDRRLTPKYIAETVVGVKDQQTLLGAGAHRLISTEVAVHWVQVKDADVHYNSFPIGPELDKFVIKVDVPIAWTLCVHSGVDTYLLQIKTNISRGSGDSVHAGWPWSFVFQDPTLHSGVVMLPSTKLYDNDHTSNSARYLKNDKQCSILVFVMVHIVGIPWAVIYCFIRMWELNLLYIHFCGLHNGKQSPSPTFFCIQSFTFMVSTINHQIQRQADSVNAALCEVFLLDGHFSIFNAFSKVAYDCDPMRFLCAYSGASRMEHHVVVLVKALMYITVKDGSVSEYQFCLTSIPIVTSFQMDPGIYCSWLLTARIHCWANVHMATEFIMVVQSVFECSFRQSLVCPVLRDEYSFHIQVEYYHLHAGYVDAALREVCLLDVNLNCFSAFNHMFKASRRHGTYVVWLAIPCVTHCNTECSTGTPLRRPSTLTKLWQLINKSPNADNAVTFPSINARTKVPSMRGCLIWLGYLNAFVSFLSCHKDLTQLQKPCINALGVLCTYVAVLHVFEGIIVHTYHNIQAHCIRPGSSHQREVLNIRFFAPGISYYSLLESAVKFSGLFLLCTLEQGSCPTIILFGLMDFSTQFSSKMSACICERYQTLIWDVLYGAAPPVLLSSVARRIIISTKPHNLLHSVISSSLLQTMKFAQTARCTISSSVITIAPFHMNKRVGVRQGNEQHIRVIIIQMVSNLSTSLALHVEVSDFYTYWFILWVMACNLTNKFLGTDIHKWISKTKRRSTAHDGDLYPLSNCSQSVADSKFSLRSSTFQVHSVLLKVTRVISFYTWDITINSRLGYHVRCAMKMVLELLSSNDPSLNSDLPTKKKCHDKIFLFRQCFVAVSANALSDILTSGESIVITDIPVMYQITTRWILLYSIISHRVRRVLYTDFKMCLAYFKLFKRVGFWHLQCKKPLYPFLHTGREYANSKEDTAENEQSL